MSDSISDRSKKRLLLADHWSNFLLISSQTGGSRGAEYDDEDTLLWTLPRKHIRYLQDFFLFIKKRIIYGHCLFWVWKLAWIVCGKLLFTVIFLTFIGWKIKCLPGCFFEEKNSAQSTCVTSHCGGGQILFWWCQKDQRTFKKSALLRGHVTSPK